MQTIIITVILLSILGLIIGIFLGVFSNVFKVETNEMVSKIRETLPGNNCGACGYAGCDQMAQAIFDEIAPINACPVGGQKVADELSKLLNRSATALDRKVAFVHCNGSCLNTDKIYEYENVNSCLEASILSRGRNKSCRFSCIGLGDCVKKCQFDAIHITNFVAEVEKEKCTACTECIKTCPIKIIDLVSFKKKHLVRCVNKDIGKLANNVCKTACIACKMCEKACKLEAIKVIDNLATMDYEKCKDCGLCEKACPKKAII